MHARRSDCCRYSRTAPQTMQCSVCLLSPMANVYHFFVAFAIPSFWQDTASLLDFARLFTLFLVRLSSEESRVAFIQRNQRTCEFSDAKTAPRTSPAPAFSAQLPGP